MRTPGWSTTGNTHQCFGITAYNLMAEVMGDDMIMGAQGSGWFWFDATYNVKSRYVYTSWRSYDLWNAYYTWIANANY
ncbi:MAG: RagB/SusD family nutrient uptake outer membrane protein, partial [Muribaculaceae bacterium]|nr:RagB/SusD family nutrient uptake outer membrane protein [Muribaculaceae bacterium]